jgi:hypothetical protein
VAYHPTIASIEKMIGSSIDNFYLHVIANVCIVLIHRSISRNTFILRRYVRLKNMQNHWIGS